MQTYGVLNFSVLNFRQFYKEVKKVSDLLHHVVHRLHVSQAFCVWLKFAGWCSNVAPTQVVEAADVLIEVLDARNPEATRCAQVCAVAALHMSTVMLSQCLRRWRPGLRVSFQTQNLYCSC